MSRGAFLLGALALLGCESNALSLDDPTAFEASLEPDYLEGDTASTLLLTFDDLGDVADATGDPATWQVVAVDVGELYLQGYRFLSNFQVELELAAQLPECVGVVSPGCARAAVGQHDLVLQISNHYGTFTLQITVLVFP